MKSKTTKTKPRRPFRNFPDEIDVILHGYGPRAHVVQLWRKLDGKSDLWTYLGRLQPEQCEIEMIGQRFGGGEYRASSSANGTASAARKSTSSKSRSASPRTTGR